MEPVRRYVGNALGTLAAAFAGTGLKIDTVQGCSGIWTDPSTARGSAIWRSTWIIRTHLMPSWLPSVVIDGVRLSSANRAISIG
jgi:hypothetical protein